jgi:cellulose synthase/poly-beta-1,6-N-acetylglucosamine synthase-like glycosyltransferase
MTLHLPRPDSAHSLPVPFRRAAGLPGPVAVLPIRRPQPPAVPAAPPPSPRPDPASAEALAAHLLRDGVVPPDAVVAALERHRAQGGAYLDHLVAAGLLTEAAACALLAGQTGLPQVDPLTDPADPAAVQAFGVQRCQSLGLLPWRDAGGATVVLAARPETLARHRADLETCFGRVIPALAPADRLEQALLTGHGAALNRMACSRVADAESCRTWGQGGGWVWLIVFLCALACLGLASPMAVAFLFTGWAVVTLLAATLLKAAAALATLRRAAPEPPAPIIARQPMVSVMVALYREADIAPRLIRRLGRLDYPRDLLEILLVVEADDRITRRALTRAHLPPWMRVITVPDGQIKTKPRALNHALTACRGQIVGIYDAEDAPAPDQIRRVVDRFHARPAEVACLQGVLDFYNPRTNWLSRCFTIEYATWFRVILPGLQRLGFAIPLGGTTLFFRRAALERLGAWDAHNVTEDADLGMRLARHGYRTEIIDTVTEEEANCRTIPWVRQRSRWLKGYMMTYAVHMRAPGLLLRQLGAWKFFGFQVFFLTTLSQFLLAPILWSFWLVPLGVRHPVSDMLPPALHLAMFGTYLLTEAVLLVVGVISLRLTPNRINPLWVPMLHFYFPLGALASYKALWELVTRPFWWDKTSHGLFDPAEPGSGEPRSPEAAPV